MKISTSKYKWKSVLMLFPNRHLSQRQVLNFSIKSDEAWEVVNTIMVRLKKKLKSQNYMRIIAKIYKIILILEKFIQKLPLWTLLWFYMKYIGTTGDDEQLINSSKNHRPFPMFFSSGVYPPTTCFLGSYHLKCGMLFIASNFVSSVNNLK